VEPRTQLARKTWVRASKLKISWGPTVSHQVNAQPEYRPDRLVVRDLFQDLLLPGLDRRKSRKPDLREYQFTGTKSADENGG
jgi:hypothetical protein